jgi:hypothetical protein
MGSKAKATRQTPSAASKRISFMLACFESLSVSTRGLPKFGPECWSSLVIARASSCTSFGSERNSGSNSSPISTVHSVPNIPPSVYRVKRILTIGRNYQTRRVGSGRKGLVLWNQLFKHSGVVLELTFPQKRKAKIVLRKQGMNLTDWNRATKKR